MSELNHVLNNNQFVVVDFHATWCGPCKAIAPKLKSLCEENGVTLYKIDVDEEPDIAAIYSIESLPTILFFKGGAKFGTVIGAKLDKIKEMITKMK